MSEVKETIGMMSNAIAHLLVWAKHLESQKIVPSGSLRYSALLLDLSDLQHEMEVLESYQKQSQKVDSQEFKEHIENRILLIKKKTSSLKEEIKSLNIQLSEEEDLI